MGLAVGNELRLGRRRGLAMSGGSSFDPLSLSPTVWLKADALSLNDADPVASWTDSSGNGNHAAQATAAAKPTYKTAIVNGKPVVRFDGTDDFLQVSWAAISQPTTILIVAAMNNSACFYFDGQSGAARHAFGDALDAAGRHGIYAGTAVVDAVQATPTGFNYWTCVFNGTSSSIRKNGAAFASSATNVGSNTLAGMTLGASSSGVTGSLNGDIAEVLVYNSALSAGNRAATESYLTGRYAL